MATAYISSTYVDLQECREQVARVVRQMGHVDIAMEYYVSEHDRPKNKCVADVARSDVYIGLFAWRYGHAPQEDNPDSLSITELEYQQAIKSNKPCLIFMHDAEAPWPPKYIDDDKSNIKRLRELLQEHHTISYFKSPQELGTLVAAALHKVLSAEPTTRREGRVDFTKYYAAVRKRYRRLNLDALTPPQKEEYLQLELQSLFIPQAVREEPPPVEVPKEIQDKLERGETLALDELPSGISPEAIQSARTKYLQKPRMPILRVLSSNQYKHVVLLGDRWIRKVNARPLPAPRQLT